jgi:hypothetical protein
MTATRIKDLTLHDVHTRFALRPSQAVDFFPEWQVTLPMVSELERERLREIQMDYLYQSESILIWQIYRMWWLG